jgi:hypothetical protein
LVLGLLMKLLENQIMKIKIFNLVFQFSIYFSIILQEHELQGRKKNFSSLFYLAF